MVVLWYIEERNIDEEPSNKCYYHTKTCRTEPYTIWREREMGGEVLERVHTKLNVLVYCIVHIVLT